MALFSLRRIAFLLFFVISLLNTAVRASLTPAQLGEYLESGSLIKWQTAVGDWRLESNAGFTKDGVDSIRTPPLGNNTSVAFSGAVTGPGVLRGWVRVSSERFQDHLGVSLNGIVMSRWSGQQTTDFELRIPPGPQTLGVSWTKDGSLTEGLDAAWLDQVIFAPDTFSVAEALDLPAGSDPGKVQFSVPAGMSPWSPFFTPAASNGGDALISSPLAGGLRLGLLATLQGPAVVEFRTRPARSPIFASTSTFPPIFPQPGGVTVSFQPTAGGKVLEQALVGDWTIHKVLVPRSGNRININASTGTNGVDAQLLDHMKIVPALPVSSLAEALDAPGQIFSGNWVFVTNGPALNEPWMVLPEGTTAGFGIDDDIVVAAPCEVQSLSTTPYSIRELSTELTGPGRVSFWCRVEANATSGTLLNTVLTSIEGTPVSHTIRLKDPSFLSFVERVVEVPPGRWKVAIQWSSGAVFALNQWRWTPTEESLPAPSVEAAAGAAGLAITQTGNWQGAAWPEGGLTDNSAAVWNPLPGATAPENPLHLLRAASEGAGWATFALQTGGSGSIVWEADGIPYTLSCPLPHHPGTSWVQVARRFAPGLHHLTWTANGNARARAPWMVRLDGLGFGAAAPSWLSDLEVPDGMDYWRMEGGNWLADSAIRLIGTTSLRTPPLPQFCSSTIHSTFRGPGILRFWWRTQTQRTTPLDNSSISYWDNENSSIQLSSAEVWTERAVTFRNEGDIHTSWTFIQKAAAGAPQDAAWLDGFSFTQTLPPTLAEAMDTPTRTWTSTGPVAALSGPGLEWATGLDAVRLGPVTGNTAWIETTVQGAGVASFRSTQVANVSVNGVRVAKLTGLVTFRLTGPGPHVCRIEGATDVDDFHFFPLPLVTPAEALDLPAATTVSITGALPGCSGIADTIFSYDGVDAVRLEETDTAENSTAEASLAVALNGPCRIRFRWKSDGAGVASYGSPAVTRSGEFGWTEVDHLVLGAELNTFVIRLDSEGVGNTKTLWVDQMVIEPLRPASLAEALQNSVSLQMAMDDPGRVWETSPDNPYVGFASYETGSTADGIDGAMPFRTTPGSWLQTTVQGPNRVYFGHINFKGKFSVNGQPLKVNAISSWAGLTFETGPGPNVLRWEDTGPLDSFSVTPLQTTLADALDFPGYWRIATSGSSPSNISFTDTSDGQDAVFSRTTTITGGAGYRLDVIGPGKMEFMAKTPTTNPISDLLFSENGTWQGYYQPWWSPQIIDTIPPGPQLLSWPSGNSSDSTQYVARDQVRFTRYQETTLNTALDNHLVTLSSDPASPWQGWDAGSAAFDSQDAAISNGSTSWLDITLPPGAGELRLMARSPIKITTQPNPFISPTIRINNISRTLSIPQNWKKLVYPISATDSRTVRMNPGSIYLWLDRLDFVPASDAFASWRAAQGLPSDVAMNSDSDGDNIPVLLEYALGLDASRPGAADPGMPSDAGLPVFETVSVSPGEVLLQCRYYRRKGSSKIRYAVRFSNEPSTASALPAADTSVVNVNNDWEQVTVRDPINSFPGPRFGRLWVTFEP